MSWGSWRPSTPSPGRPGRAAGWLPAALHLQRAASAPGGGRVRGRRGLRQPRRGTVPARVAEAAPGGDEQRVRGGNDRGEAGRPMRLLSDDILERSAVVANCRMNRERGLVGSNGYAKELGFNPLDLLRERLP